MTEIRRIRPPARFEKLIDHLTSEGIFQTKQAAMMFAAALGRRFTGRKPLEKPGDGVRWHIFENSEDAAFVNALALADTEVVDVLDPTNDEAEDVATIFEEYVAGGFEYLESNLLARPGDRLENLLAVMQEARMSQQEPPPGLEGLDSSTLKLLGDLED